MEKRKIVIISDAFDWTYRDLFLTWRLFFDSFDQTIVAPFWNTSCWYRPAGKAISTQAGSVLPDLVLLWHFDRCLFFTINNPVCLIEKHQILQQMLARSGWEESAFSHWQEMTQTRNSRFINYGSASSLRSLASHLLSHTQCLSCFRKNRNEFPWKPEEQFVHWLCLWMKIERLIEGWIIGRTSEKNERIRTLFPRPRRATSTGQDERYDRKREE